LPAPQTERLSLRFWFWVYKKVARLIKNVYINGMLCISCQKKTKVTHTIPILGGTVIKRRRKCKKCKRAFMTLEYAKMGEK